MLRRNVRAHTSRSSVPLPFIICYEPEGSRARFPRSAPPPSLSPLGEGERRVPNVFSRIYRCGPLLTHHFHPHILLSPFILAAPPHFYRLAVINYPC